MPRKPSPSLLAHKAINLAGDLTASEKRVAAVLIDSYNFKTGQCDPGLNTLAKLLRVGRRTVIRATGALAKKGCFRKVRHGGYFHRNSYEPIWSRFELDEMAWALHRKASRYRKSVPEVAPSMGQMCHDQSDTGGTQTFPCNKFPEISNEARAAGKIKNTGEAAENKNVEERAKVRQPTQRRNGSVGPEMRFAEDSMLDSPTRELIASCAAIFEKRLRPDELKAWFNKVEINGYADGCLVFSAPTAFVRSRIERDYSIKMEECFCRNIEGAARIKIVVR